MHIDEALSSRRSVRAFNDAPVTQATVAHILQVASRAPSGTNCQPWRVYVAAGATKQAISDDTIALRTSGVELPQSEYVYSPKDIGEPYLSRRRKVGWDLYGLLDIGKGDRERTFAQHNRNFTFFGAPVALFFFVERHLERGAWLDVGMFLQGVMSAARGQGLHTCPQVAWTNYHAIVRRHLGVPETELLVCGMSLGVEDTSAIENSLRTERAPVAEMARFVGF